MRTRCLFRLVSIALTILIVVGAPTWVFAHSERPTESPERPGSVPDENRIPTATIDVCKSFMDSYLECQHQDIQTAVDAASDGALIRIWPGLYEELPSRGAPSLPPGPEGFYAYEHHLTNPNSQNLIAIIGKKNITLEGMGQSPIEVVIDVAFTKHVGIRGDRADGLIIKNLSVWHAFDHGVYVLDQDGFIIDDVVSGFSREYSFLTFAVDHGVLRNCEAIGAGDAGIYPGGTANTPGRHAVEVDHCKTHHNVLGYSGTQGNFVWMHDSEVFDNAVGMTSDSETDHPNYPQEHLTLERNLFYDNNFNVYAETSDVAATVFAGEILIPVGTGVFLASGNDNLIRENRIWGHDRYGLWLASGQGLVLGPTSDPPAAPFVSSRNEFARNKMFSPSGNGRANAIDFGWDGLGLGNCWEDNFRDEDENPPTTDGVMLPPCKSPAGPVPTTLGVPNVQNMQAQIGLVFVGDEPLECRWRECVWGPGPAPGRARNLPDGYRKEWPDPPTCGPVTCTQ